MRSEREIRDKIRELQREYNKLHLSGVLSGITIEAQIRALRWVLGELLELP